MTLGIARGLAERGADNGATRPFFAAVADETRIVMCAFMSLPDRLGLARSHQPGAVDALAADVLAYGPEVRFVAGIEPTAGEVAAAFSRLCGLQAQAGGAHRSQRIHRLDRVHASPRARAVHCAQPIQAMTR
jgi:hypothetical protein